MKNDIKIERLNIAAFGKLCEKDIALDEGINLISAPNEGGKTTMAAFTRFALYGFTGKSQKIADNPKKMYMPWSGAAASGALTLQNGKRIRIERCVAGNKETTSCTDVATGAPLYSGNYGEELFGVGADVFEKTLFLSGAEPPQSKDAELADKLQNLVFSADEQISEEKAEKLLTKHKNALKGRTSGSGRIYELETESATLTEALRTERAAAEELYALEAENAKTAEEIICRQAEEAAAEAELANYEKYEAFMLLKERDRLEKEVLRTAKAAESGSVGLEEIERLQALKSEYDKAEDRRKDKEAEYCELAAAKPDMDTHTVQRAEAAKKKREKLKKLSIALTILTVLCLGAAVAFKFIPSMTGYFSYAAVAAAVFAGAALATFGAKSAALKSAGLDSDKEIDAVLERGRKQTEDFKLHSARTADAATALEDARRAEEKATAAFKEALTAHGADTEDGDAAISELLKQHIASETLKAEAKNAATALEVFEGRYDMEALAALAEGATEPQKPKTQIEIEKKAASQRIAMYKDKLSQINQRIAAIKAMGYDPLSTAEALSYTLSELNRCKKHYDALSIALEELGAAGDEMKASISPRLANTAGRYFAALTEGDHEGLELDTKLSLSFATPYGQKNGEHLSRGARDGVYICLRLALIELLFEGRRVPFVLDDAFAHIDTPRLKRMLALLAESGHQLIISSCSGREKAALDELGLKYKHITL